MSPSQPSVSPHSSSALVFPRGSAQVLSAQVLSATRKFYPSLSLVVAAIACAFPACSDAPEAPPSAVSMLPIADHTVRVGAELRVPIGVNNPDGLALTYAFEGPELPALREVASIGGTSNGGEFVWSPLASHVGTHDIVFVLRSQWDEVRETSQITITPNARSAPIFLTPGAGGTFDLSRSPCVAFDIEVRDDDSPDVLFEAVSLPAGAALTSTGAKSAEFSWCPSSEQLATSLRWEITFSADDGEHPPTEHVFVAILRADVKEDCPGTPPVVTIVSPEKGDLVATTTGYEVIVHTEDDIGVRDSPVLHWTTHVEDEDNPDLSRFTTLFCAPHDAPPGTPDGEGWRCLIPPLDLARDEQQVIYVVVSATDNDDPNGTTCDHHADSDLLRFVAVGGAQGSVPICGACTASTQCASGLCASTPTGGLCLPGCVGNECERGECTESTMNDGSLRAVCAPPADLCETEPPIACTPDDFEPNDTPESAAAIEPGILSATLCEGDLDHYTITLQAGTELSALLDGFRYEDQDLDLSLWSDDARELARSAGIEDAELITWCARDARPLLLRVEGILDAQSPYELTLITEADACCPNDIGEPDSRTNPRIIEAGDPIEGTICPDDEDFFAFEIATASRISIELIYDPEVGDLDIELLNEAGDTVDASISAGDEQITYDATELGIYTLRVYGFSGASGDYLGELHLEPL